MSIKLFFHNNLGFPNEYRLLLKNVLSEEPKSIRDVRQYCMSLPENVVYSLDGIIDFLEFLSIVIVEDDTIRLNPSKIDKDLSDEFKLREIIIYQTFENLKKLSLLNEFIRINFVKYDIPNNTISIKNSSIPLQYSGIKNLLINFGFFNISPETPNLLLIDPIFVQYFTDNILQKIRVDELSELIHNSLSYNRFLELNDLKYRFGEDAENFILLFEIDRLANHPKKDMIRIISKIDVSAGYDIVSFESLESIFVDRFIEVKSYSKEPYFYWSKNEIETARIKGDRYYLYLVDRDFIHVNDYSPVIIQNPYSTIFINEDCEKIAQSWYISLKHLRL